MNRGELFPTRKRIAGQVLEKQLEDGGITVSGKVAYTNQVFSIVRHWIPNVQIKSPTELHTELYKQP